MYAEITIGNVVQRIKCDKILILDNNEKPLGGVIEKDHSTFVQGWVGEKDFDTFLNLINFPFPELKIDIIKLNELPYGHRNHSRQGHN